mmetsp:Transcript_54125/g.150562  ORF Transcript_54125/g.150562 Transcript_54125/m.150562 type:complete len:280 (+) Transcript_54125:74-913(+)
MKRLPNNQFTSLPARPYTFDAIARDCNRAMQCAESKEPFGNFLKVMQSLLASLEVRLAMDLVEHFLKGDMGKVELSCSRFAYAKELSSFRHTQQSDPPRAGLEVISRAIIEVPATLGPQKRRPPNKGQEAPCRVILSGDSDGATPPASVVSPRSIPPPTPRRVIVPVLDSNGGFNNDDGERRAQYNYAHSVVNMSSGFSATKPLHARLSTVQSPPQHSWSGGSSGAADDSASAQVWDLHSRAHFVSGVDDSETDRDSVDSVIQSATNMARYRHNCNSFS